MAKTIIRVDDRLIHGQTIIAWCPTLNIQEIIGIDDVSAQNPMLKSIMTMGVPKQYITHIVTTEQAKALIGIPSNNIRLVIVKYPSLLKEIKDSVLECEQIILGNMAKREDTNHQVSGATGIFYLSDQDITEIDTLVNQGFKVDFQQLPNASGMSWETFKKSL